MTIYRVKVLNETIEVDIPTGCQDTAFVLVEDEAGRCMVGVELAHGEAIAGHWPDEEEWVDKIHVDNPLGSTYDADAPLGAVVIRHPAQDDLLAVARAVGVTED